MLKIELIARGHKEWCIHTSEEQLNLHVGQLSYAGNGEWKAVFTDQDGDEVPRDFEADSVTEVKPLVETELNKLDMAKEVEALIEKLSSKDKREHSMSEDAFVEHSKQVLMALHKLAFVTGHEGPFTVMLSEVIGTVLAMTVPKEKQSGSVNDIAGIVKKTINAVQEDKAGALSVLKMLMEAMRGGKGGDEGDSPKIKIMTGEQAEAFIRAMSEGSGVGSTSDEDEEALAAKRKFMH